VIRGQAPDVALNWADELERVTRIELALSAWEAGQLRSLGALTCRPRQPGVPAADP